MGKKKICSAEACTSSSEETGLRFFNFPRDSARYEQDLKYYYKTYCSILASVIKEAKNLHYNQSISNSSNKMKTTWSIIKSDTGRKISNAGQFLNIDGKLTDNHDVVTDSFNN